MLFVVLTRVYLRVQTFRFLTLCCTKAEMSCSNMLLRFKVDCLNGQELSFRIFYLIYAQIRCAHNLEDLLLLLDTDIS